MKITREIEFHTEKIESFDVCGKKLTAYKGSAFELPFITLPTKGEHDYNTCEGCKGTWRSVYESAKLKFDKFPLCCNEHANLVKLKGFDKEKYGDLPAMIADKTIFAIQHFHNFIKAENWYLEITNYWEYTIQSFGQMPTNCGEPVYLGNFIRTIRDIIDINETELKDKAQKLHEYLDTHTTPPKKAEHDFFELLKIYNKWFEIFPFEHSFFADLKGLYQAKIPVFETEPIYNPYLDMSSARMISKYGLIEGLLFITNDLLTRINSLALYEKGLLTDSDKLKLEFIISKRKLKLKEGYGNNGNDKLGDRFRKIIKEWLEDEKKFIDEIKPLLIETSSKLDSSTEHLSLKQVALIHVYKKIQITRKNGQEIAKEYGFTSKTSGEALFQTYTKYSSSSYRRSKPNMCTSKLLSNKILLFESVANYLKENEKGLLNDELSILKKIFEAEYQ